MMNEDIKYTSTDSDPCNTSTYTVTLNGADVTLNSIPLTTVGSFSDAVQVKVEMSPSDASTLISENAVLVETSRGLLLSVADGVGCVSYTNISTTADDQGRQLIPLPASLFSTCQQEDGVENDQHGHIFDSSSVPSNSSDVSVCQQPGSMFDNGVVTTDSDVVGICQQTGSMFDSNAVSADTDIVGVCRDTSHMFDGANTDSDVVGVESRSGHMFDAVSAADSLVHDTHLSETTTTVTTNTSLQPNGQNIEIKKKKGGWPKGKKRKTSPEVHTPRAPMTGYVLYAIDRRQEIKESNPDMLFSDVTKILGQEWSTMPAEKKQKYLDEAEADKRRYIEELKTFHQSEAYHNYVRKKKMKNFCVEGTTGVDSGSYTTSMIDLNEDCVNELYCRVCRQYFSSLHNKKEHMFGRQHLQAVTGELEKEIHKQQQQQQQQETMSSTPLLVVDMTGESLGSLSDSDLTNDAQTLPAPVNIESFIQQFIHKNYEREQEIQMLKRAVKTTQESNFSMIKEIQELRAYESKLESDIKDLKAFSMAQSIQIDGLKMVPTLFGVINFS